MISHSYPTDTQSKAYDLSSSVLAAASPPQIIAACAAVESFLQEHTPDQTRWFFSITFPTLICQLFGFDVSSAPQKQPPSPTGWIDLASDNPELSGRIFSLLSPHGVLLSSVLAVDELSLVKYVFPVERLPEWVRYMLQNKHDAQVLADLCPLFKNRLKEDPIKGTSYQVQLTVLEYYLFWFAYYPVCRGNNEGSETVKVQRSKRFRLENWAYSIPCLTSTKRSQEKRSEGNLYLRLLYAYLRDFVPQYDLNAHQPYRCSLLHYSSLYDVSVIEHAELLLHTLIQFWLVDNDFSPLPVNMCKSVGVTFPFRSVLGESPPTFGLGEVVNLLVNYLSLSSASSSQVEYNEKLRWNYSGSLDTKDSSFHVHSASSWNLLIQRPLYRYILRTFLFFPMGSSIKNVSQVFTLWVNYMEPWKSNLDEFTELDPDIGVSTKPNETTQSSLREYSSSWQGFVLSNYLFYSSMVMHFIGFAHKFLHSDAGVMVQMVSKVVNILISSRELMDLIKNVDTVFHTRPPESSKSMLKALYRFVPVIQDQLKDWEDGLCESDVDGSFLHENWNKDLRLFSDGEDGGQQLLQLFLLRAESELQATSGDNFAQDMQCLENLKTQINCLYDGNMVKYMPGTQERGDHQDSRNEIFKPRCFFNHTVPDMKYKGDWMKRPISNDEVAWLAKLLVRISNWLNESLRLNQVDGNDGNPGWSYVELSRDSFTVLGPTETIKMVFRCLISWFVALGGAGLKLMRKNGLKVNLRMLASKKVVALLSIIVVLSILRKAFAIWGF